MLFICFAIQNTKFGMTKLVWEYNWNMKNTSMNPYLTTCKYWYD